MPTADIMIASMRESERFHQQHACDEAEGRGSIRVEEDKIDRRKVQGGEFGT